MAADRSLYAEVEVADDGSVVVDLDRDHPGFADPAYRARRNSLAALSVDWKPGDPIPAPEYTETEHQVWRIVSGELAARHERDAVSLFLEAKDRLRLPGDHIPQLTEVTDRLVPLTGFQYLPVAGLAPLRAFYRSFGDATFYSTQYIRHHSVPLYTPEPDIVHEVVGHANQLAAPVFADLYRAVGKAVARTRSDDALRFLSRVFWFTFEFGVVRERGELRAYGAGILSSFGEMDAFRRAEIHPLNFVEMGTAVYDITHYQPVLYAADSVEHLVNEVSEFVSTFDDDAHQRLLAEVSR
jgi:phenylalanine-4-hydroxylase